MNAVAVLAIFALLVVALLGGVLVYWQTETSRDEAMAAERRAAEEQRDAMEREGVGLPPNMVENPREGTDLAKTVTRLEHEVKQLRRELDETNKELDRHKELLMVRWTPPFPVPPNPPPIDGHVVSVSPDRKSLVLSVGRNADVKKAMRFHVSRGDSYVGEIMVVEVDDTTSTALVITLRPGAEIKPKDAAATRL